MYNYLPHTPSDRAKIFQSLNISSMEDLLNHIPKSLRNFELTMNNGLSEVETLTKLQEFANRNKHGGNTTSFIGGGVYNRYIPSIVHYITSRSEFLTAYTPYQPEASQGSLQAIYEFQTAICNLTGMDVANASMYDGASASAEAVLMALRINKDRSKVLVLESVHPEYRDVIKTYLRGKQFQYQEIPFNIPALVTYRDDIYSKMDDQTACIVVQVPSFFGTIENMNDIRHKAQEKGILLIIIADPLSLGLLASPSSYDADIVVGDGQQLGIPVSLGGPSFGFFACREKYVRQMPGRIVGMSIDGNGRPAFTLTLQAREQHIKRSRATSNICTNQALMALMGLVYFSVIGPQGLREIGYLSYHRAHYLANKLACMQEIHLVTKQFVNEFVVTLDENVPVEELLDLLLEYDIIGGLSLTRFYPKLNNSMRNSMMIAVTEMNSIADLNYYISMIRHAVGEVKKNRVVVHG